MTLEKNKRTNPRTRELVTVDRGPQKTQGLVIKNPFGGGGVGKEKHLSRRGGGEESAKGTPDNYLSGKETSGGGKNRPPQNQGEVARNKGQLNKQIRTLCVLCARWWALIRRKNDLGRGGAKGKPVLK